jgi:tetratricopeptide (TPR) repeat protein
MAELAVLAESAAKAVERATIERLLRSAPPDDVRAELGRLDACELGAAEAAARTFAHGALALREGRLDDAFTLLDDAAARFEAGSEREAAALARCEVWLAAIRRGPRSVYREAADALADLATQPGATRLVKVVADHYRGTALRYGGQTEATLRVLLEAFAASEGLFAERAQVLNSLGTLYVVLGAFGAARAVLEHAAELNHQVGDAVSEAISYGQLGSAALGLGELESARRFLQRQEWFASRVGDAFGRARALTLLADVAIDLGRPDDAIVLAEQAREVAGSVTPPLAMWVAYATRSIGRARTDMGEPTAVAALEEARQSFARIGNQLGQALVSWDLARASNHGCDDERWHEAAWAFAGLGLGARVAQVLGDLRGRSPEEAPSPRGLASEPPRSVPRPSRETSRAQMLDSAYAAVAQIYGHLASAQEVELVLSEPDTVARIATRRIGGQRNLGRIAAQMIAPPGLFVAAIAAGAIGTGLSAMPSRRSAAILIGQLPGVALWGWSSSADTVEVARDLSSARVALGEDTRVVLCCFDEARVVAAPFAGEMGAELTGADIGPLVRQALADPPATLRRIGDFTWEGEAEALARMSGYQSS